MHRDFPFANFRSTRNWTRLSFSYPTTTCRLIQIIKSFQVIRANLLYICKLPHRRTFINQSCHPPATIWRNPVSAIRIRTNRHSVTKFCRHSLNTVTHVIRKRFLIIPVFVNLLLRNIKFLTAFWQLLQLRNIKRKCFCMNINPHRFWPNLLTIHAHFNFINAHGLFIDHSFNLIINFGDVIINSINLFL